jgi:ABC-2 type transport system permease protein
MPSQSPDALYRPPRPGYLALLLVQIQQGIASPSGTLIDTLASLLSVATVYYLWRALFLVRPQIAGFSWHDMQAYVLTANVLFALLGATSPRPLMEAIRTGAIVSELLRPYSLVGAQLAQALGRALSQSLLSSALTALVGLVLVRMALPPSPAAGGLFLLSVALSFLTSFLLNLLLALLCFWTRDSEGLLWAHGVISYIFSGGMAPFAFLPGWLQMLALVLPFRGLIDTPLRIYRGAAVGSELWLALGLQALWIALLLVAVQRLWRRGLRAAELPGG